MSDCCGSDACSTTPVAPEKSSFLQGNKDAVLAAVSFVLLAAGIILKELVRPGWFGPFLQLFLFSLAYIPVGVPVLLKAFRQIKKGDFFNEFFLMGIATLGAFFLGEYAEGVAVMLFYAVGELFQGAAVNRAKRSIEKLLKVQVEEVSVVQNDGSVKIFHPSAVAVGSTIRIKPGEKVALDGELTSEKGTFNTAALTGESVPDRKYKGEPVYAGMINLDTVVELKVINKFEDSKLSRILGMVQEAAGRKAKTQRFITRFAKVYTPIVVVLAVLITLLPFLFVNNYVFEEWLYRALVFLVISCPCALMISIPLGYFGGIGAASRNGILFKGSNFLDQMRKVDTLVMDKTGTLTLGVFNVKQVEVLDFDKDLFLTLVAALEQQSTHPVAKAITSYSSGLNFESAKVMEADEVTGMGMRGKIEEFEVLAGNSRLLKKFGIPYDPAIDSFAETTVLVAINDKYCGYITIADEIKEDAVAAVEELRSAGIKKLVMLSGDRNAVVQKVAQDLNIDFAKGELLPEGKMAEVEKLKKTCGTLAFVGDGLNDAPVIALADIGIAMGGLGSDATIETADVVIQTDQPSKVATAVRISKATHKIVWQNIGLAFGVKVLVLAFGAVGIASMWEAVFADVGVTILAIFNAMRIQQKDFSGYISNSKLSEEQTSKRNVQQKKANEQVQL